VRGIFARAHNARADGARTESEIPVSPFSSATPKRKSAARLPSRLEGRAASSRYRLPRSLTFVSQAEPTSAPTGRSARGPLPARGSGEEHAMARAARLGAPPAECAQAPGQVERAEGDAHKTAYWDSRANFARKPVGAFSVEEEPSPSQTPFDVGQLRRFDGKLHPGVHQNGRRPCSIWTSYRRPSLGARRALGQGRARWGRARGRYREQTQPPPPPNPPLPPLLCAGSAGARQTCGEGVTTRPT